MNKTLMAAGLAVILGACSSSKKSDVAEGATPNPFFAEYTTPFGVPPFDQIEVAHYKPALLKGMEEQRRRSRRSWQIRCADIREYDRGLRPKWRVAY